MNSTSDQRLRRSVKEHGGVVTRSLRRLGVPEPVVDDAAQQVLLVLHRRLPDVRTGCERAFMLATAHRVAADVRKMRRRSREETAPEILDVVADAAPSPEELLDRGRARVLVDRAVASLPEDLRTVFVLMELEEKSTAYVAALLEVPSGTVASRLRRARAAYDDAITRLSRPKPRKALVLVIPAAKWLSIAALAAGVAMAIHSAWPTPPPQAQPRSAPIVAVALPSPITVAPIVTAVQAPKVTTPTTITKRAVPSAVGAPRAVVPVVGIEEQLDALRRIRASLAVQQAEGASAQLDAFERTYPRSPLAEEAHVLRIDALAAAGKPAEAARAAESFQMQHPNSAFREHVTTKSSAP